MLAFPACVQRQLDCSLSLGLLSSPPLPYRGRWNVYNCQSCLRGALTPFIARLGDSTRAAVFARTGQPLLVDFDVFCGVFQSIALKVSMTVCSSSFKTASPLYHIVLR